MPGTKISPDAEKKLQILSEWLHGSTEFVEEQKNLSRCVDENRHAKVRPLLKELGFDVKVGGFALMVNAFLIFLGTWLQDLAH